MAWPEPTFSVDLGVASRRGSSPRIENPKTYDDWHLGVRLAWVKAKDVEIEFGLASLWPRGGRGEITLIADSAVDWGFPVLGMLVVPRAGWAASYDAPATVSLGESVGAGILIPLRIPLGLRLDYTYRHFHLLDGPKEWTISTLSVGLVQFSNRLARP